MGVGGGSNARLIQTRLNCIVYRLWHRLRRDPKFGRPSSRFLVYRENQRSVYTLLIFRHRAARPAIGWYYTSRRGATSYQTKQTKAVSLALLCHSYISFCVYGISRAVSAASGLRLPLAKSWQIRRTVGTFGSAGWSAAHSRAATKSWYRSGAAIGMKSLSGLGIDSVCCNSGPASTKIITD